jgi:uncharacterized protein YjbI with pentapeptide repeats
MFASIGFSNCKFPGTKLSFLDFGNASILNCDFKEAVAENCIFQKLKGGSKSERKNLDLRSCNFEKSDLANSVFVSCNLAGISFQESDLENAIFERCDLEKTNFSSAKITGAGFTDCKIKETYLDMNGFIDYGSSKGFRLK